MRRGGDSPLERAQVRTQGEGGAYSREKRPHQKAISWHLDVGPSASRTMRNECLLFKPPIYGILVTAEESVVGGLVSTPAALCLDFRRFPAL